MPRLQWDEVLAKFGGDQKRVLGLIQEKKLNPTQEGFDSDEVDAALGASKSQGKRIPEPVLDADDLGEILSGINTGESRFIQVLGTEKAAAILNFLGTPNLEDVIAQRPFFARGVDSDLLQKFARMNAQKFMQARTIAQNWNLGAGSESWVAQSTKRLGDGYNAALQAAMRGVPLTSSTQKTLIGAIDEVRALVELASLVGEFKEFVDIEKVDDIFVTAKHLLRWGMDLVKGEFSFERLTAIRKRVEDAPTVPDNYRDAA